MRIKLRIDKNGHDLSWVFVKVCFAYYWLSDISEMLAFGGDCPYPVGICGICSFNALFTPGTHYLVHVVLIIGALLYVFEKQMLWVTGFLTLLSCIIISHHESSGIHLRATPYTTVWGAQFLAYFFAKVSPGFDLSFYRRQYPVQIIAATYTIAAITKLSHSGLAWADNGANFLPVEIMKGFSYEYFDNGNILTLQEGYDKATFMIAHKSILKLLLYSSILLEGFCFLAVFNPRIRLVYGLAMLLMHIGISCYMNIFISGLVIPMVIFFINPLYLLFVFAENLITFLSKQRPGYSNNP